MGSYVLVSYQSQTCSSHCIESCITTRSPWLGKKGCAVPELEKYEYNRNQRSQEIYEASPVKNVPKKSPMHRGEELASRKGAVAKWSVSISRLEAGMQQVSAGGRGMTRKPSKRPHY